MVVVSCVFLCVFLAGENQKLEASLIQKSNFLKVSGLTERMCILVDVSQTISGCSQITSSQDTFFRLLLETSRKLWFPKCRIRGELEAG